MAVKAKVVAAILAAGQGCANPLLPAQNLQFRHDAAELVQASLNTPVVAADEAAKTTDMRTRTREPPARDTAIDAASHIATALPVMVKEASHLTEQYMAVTVVNSNGGELSTAHGRARTAPAPTGNTEPGRMLNGQKSIFKVGNGWSGRVAINDARFHVPIGDESLIEGSFVDQGNGRPQGDINVSYVDGFTVPIVCWCNENQVFTGCNKNLHQIHKCPNPNGHGSCKNSNRGKAGITTPAQFFSPCHFPGGTYAFGADNRANNLNQRCPKEQYTCCIGSECPNNPAQH